MNQIGEVIESATEGFTAQSYRLNEAPPLGSLVRVQRGEEDAAVIYGVVARIETASVDPARRAVARGESAASLQEIYDQHPQLKELFRTLFEVRVVGHALRAGEVHHYLPPLPPEVHQLVFPCDDGDVEAFTARLTFLPLLLSSGGNGLQSDEAAGAFLRAAAMARGTGGQAFLIAAGKQLVALLRGDSARLSALLARLR